MRTLGVMGALPEEVQTLVAALQAPTVQHYAGVDYHMGQLGGHRLVVCCAGMGKVNAASVTQVLISRFEADGILFSGIAGNMSPHIGIGDVVIGSEVLYHDADHELLAQSAPGTAVYTSDALLMHAVEEGCRQTGVRYITGRIATGDRFIGDVATKKAILEAWHPACVEMEGAAVGQVAMRNGVPFVVVRAMSDNCDGSFEDLSAHEFDIQAYVKTASSIVIAAIKAL